MEVSVRMVATAGGLSWSQGTRTQEPGPDSTQLQLQRTSNNKLGPGRCERSNTHLSELLAEREGLICPDQR